MRTRINHLCLFQFTCIVGPFAACHSVVDPEPYYQACLQDLCSILPARDLVCSDIEAYADACQARGMVPEGWRAYTACSKFDKLKPFLFRVLNNLHLCFLSYWLTGWVFSPLFLDNGSLRNFNFTYGSWSLDIITFSSQGAFLNCPKSLHLYLRYPSCLMQEIMSLALFVFKICSKMGKL